MFPLISSRVSGGQPYILPLLGTLVLSLFLSMGIIFSYFLFPKFIVGIIFGSQYYGIIPYLGIFSFFMMVYTINSILNYFLLSISYYEPMLKLFLISLLQGVLIYFFHNSLYDVIWVNILVSILYFI